MTISTTSETIKGHKQFEPPTRYVLPDLPCELPPPNVPETVDPGEIAQVFRDRLACLTDEDFCEGAIWRDVFAFSGTFRTFYGHDSIIASLRKMQVENEIIDVMVDPDSACVVRIADKTAWLEARYTFTTKGSHATTCKAILSLVLGEEGEWQIWLLRTILDQLGGYPNVDKLEPVTDNKTLNGTPNANLHQSHFDCVVVGAGQAGLSVAGRLQALNLSYVILEKNESIGDNWKSRYDSVRLHTTRDSAHLPFERLFSSSKYNKYLTKDEIARAYSEWVEKYGINVWLQTFLHSGKWNSEKKMWELTTKDLANSGSRNISANHLVMALGAGGQIPKIPHFSGLNDFKGTMIHSKEYGSAGAWKGKACIVVGTGNTGHDIAEDMVAAECASVTLVQRSPTYVFAREYYTNFQDLTWNDDMPTEWADISYFSNPLAVGRLLSNFVLHERTRADPERYDALERAGYKLIRYGDIYYQLYERWGHYYMDQGAAQNIGSGLIKIKSDAVPVRYGERSLFFSDGSELDADVVVLATGFEGDAKDAIKDILGSEVTDLVEDYWGLDAEGEIKGAYKPCGHPGLWMVGASLMHARYLSRFVALHIRADTDGKPLDVYRD